MLHEQLHQPELAQRQTQGLFTTPNPDGIPIENELSYDNWRSVRPGCWCVCRFDHLRLAYCSTFANRSSSA